MARTGPTGNPFFRETGLGLTMLWHREHLVVPARQLTSSAFTLRARKVSPTFSPSYFFSGRFFCPDKSSQRTWINNHDCRSATQNGPATWMLPGPAAILYDDWGTSKAYVIGLAFAVGGYSSFWLIASMCLLTALVGANYMAICKHYPDGGGVYASVRHRSEIISIVGAFLLVADYIVTAAISAMSAFLYLDKYLGLSHPEYWGGGFHCVHRHVELFRAETHGRPGISRFSSHGDCRGAAGAFQPAASGRGGA